MFSKTISRLAYAISIHNSQGMTLSKVIIELGLNDFCRGFSFIAISRAKSLKDIAFLNNIAYYIGEGWLKISEGWIREGKGIY